MLLKKEKERFISQFSFLIYCLLISFQTSDIPLHSVVKETFSSIIYTILKQIEVSIIQIPAPSIQEI